MLPDSSRATFNTPLDEPEIQMEDQIREVMKKSVEALKEIQDSLDDIVEDLPEEAEEIRVRAQKTMNKIRDKLSESIKEAEKETEAAQVQAHLGLMEAHDKIEASRKVVDGYLTQLMQRTRTVMDEMEVKRHLAVMEAEDFWETRGKNLAEEFAKSQQTMMNVATEAAEEMQTHFKRWADIFTGTDSGKPS